MSSLSRSDSTIFDETSNNLSPRIGFPEPTAAINSYDRGDDESEKAETGLAAAVQEMIMGAIDEFLEKLPTKVTDYLHVKRGKHHHCDDDDDDDAVDETMKISRGMDIGNDQMKNDRFKVRIVEVGGSIPVKQLQDNKNGKK